MNKEKLFIIILILMLMLITALATFLNSEIDNNDKLLVMVEESQEVAEKYKDMYANIKFDNERIEEKYIEQIELLKAISKRDDKVIWHLENKVDSLGAQLDNMTQKYTDLIN